MCHLTIEVDQSIDTVSPVFNTLEKSCFYIRSVRLAPVAWSRRADVHLSLGGGSIRDLERLLAQLQMLPAVISTQHTMPAV